MNSTRNIIAVDCLQSGSLTGLRKLSESCVSVSPTNSWTSIPIKVPARLTVSDKKENGVRLYTAVLVFRSCEEPGDRDRKVYRCKTADGRYYLIGSNERPYPVCSVTDPHPDNMVDSQLYEITVSYTSACKIPYIE